MSRSSGGAVDDGRGATACSVRPPPPPPHAPTPAATASAIAMLAAQTLAPCLRSLLIVILHGPQAVVDRARQQLGRLPPLSCRQRCCAKRRASAASRNALLRARRTKGGTVLVVAGIVVVTRAGVVVVVEADALAFWLATAALNQPASSAFDASFFF